MTSKMIQTKHGVNVMKVGYGNRQKWVAFRGGNGTGQPVVDIAQAYHLVELEKRISKVLSGSSK
jgi:hypothetical protein